MTNTRTPMEILVTGVTGRIGANLAAALVREGHRVRGLVWHKDPRVEKLESLDIELVYGTLTNRTDVIKAVKGVKAIYHLGAAFQGGGPFTSNDYFETTVRGTFNVLEAAKTHSVQHVLFAGTDSVYEKYVSEGTSGPIKEDHNARLPRGWYGLSKSIGEEMCISYSRSEWVPSTVLRFCNTAGAGEIIDYGLFYLSKQLGRPELKALWRGKESVVLLRDQNGRAYKKHMGDVRDIVHGCLCALDKPAAIGETFQLGGPRAFTTDEVAPYLSEALKIPYIDVRVSGKPTFYEYDLTKARTLIGFDPQYDIFRMIDDALAFRRGELKDILATE